MFILRSLCFIFAQPRRSSPWNLSTYVSLLSRNHSNSWAIKLSCATHISSAAWSPWVKAILEEWTYWSLFKVRITALWQHDFFLQILISTPQTVLDASWRQKFICEYSRKCLASDTPQRPIAQVIYDCIQRLQFVHGLSGSLRADHLLTASTSKKALSATFTSSSKLTQILASSDEPIHL